MRKKIYCVGLIKKTIELEARVRTVDGDRRMYQTIPCTWAEGQIGSLAVFNTREEAEKYQNGVTTFPIIVFEVEEPTIQ